jgi:excisionase family DNA binding protein
MFITKTGEAARSMMTIRQMAEDYSLSRSTLYRLNRAGKLPIRKVGRRSLIAVGDVESLVQSLPTLKRNGGGVNGY